MTATELLQNENPNWILCCILFADQYGDEAAQEMALNAAKQYLETQKQIRKWPIISTE